MKYKLPGFLLLFIIIFFACFVSNAQFTIDGQQRNRFEIRNGYKSLAEIDIVPTILVTQRTRINFNFETEYFKIKISPQDVRVWGDENLSSSTGVYGDNASLSLFEGYTDLKIVQSGWLAVGRQQLVYDNQRLLAARNWNQNGLAYDAAVFRIKLSSLQVHFGSSWNSISESNTNNYYTSSRIKSLNFIWIHHENANNLKLSMLHLSTGVTETDSTNNLNFRHTTGLFAKYQNGNFNFLGNAYYQYGKNKQGLPISALLFDIDLCYKIKKLTTGVGFGYLSGNSKIGNNKTTDHLFDILYGARHKYFGSIDYFRSFASHTKQGGLADYYFYLNYKLSKSFSIQNTGHYFQLAQTNTITSNNKNLGYENDIVLKYKFKNWGALESGYAFFIPTESLKAIQEVSNNELSHFIYLQLTITPTLYK